MYVIILIMIQYKTFSFMYVRTNLTLYILSQTNREYKCKVIVNTKLKN